MDARIGRHLTVLGLTCLAAALRLPGMFHEFWFDEAWSLALVREHVHGAADILLRLRIDNNHPLNSLTMFLVGEGAAWWRYRVPAYVSGVASVPLAGLATARFGTVSSTAAMLLVAASYPLVVYSSEARGYAPMLCAVLAAIAAHQRYTDRPSLGALVTFWVATVTGMLSHLTFVHAYGALLTWSLVEAHRRHERWRDRLAGVVVRHALPMICLGLLWLTFMRHLWVAGGDPATLPSVLAETLAITAGVHPRGLWTWVAVAAVGSVLVAGVRMLWRHDGGWATLAVCGIVVMPALTIAREYLSAPHTPRFFPRYFLVSHLLLLLVTAALVGALWVAGRRRRLVAVALVTAFVIGHLTLTAGFVAGGRGEYRAAIHYLAASSADAVIRVSSTSDVRTGVLLDLYQRFLPDGRRVELLPYTSPRSAEATWRIVETVGASPPGTAAEVVDNWGSRYRLAAHFGVAGLSGCAWSVYRRVDPPVVPTPAAGPR